MPIAASQVDDSAIRGGARPATKQDVSGMELPLGASGRTNEFLDWNYAITDESKVYQRKYVPAAADWPDLPSNVREKEDFLRRMKLLGNQLDETASCVVSKWLDCADKQLGDDYEAILKRFHDNPQGLGRLDRIIGSRVAANAAEHPVFKGFIKQYSDNCTLHNESPSVRCIVAKVCQQLRVDRATADDHHVERLYAVELRSLKTVDVRKFVEDVQYWQNRLGPGKITDEAFLFRWLYRKFREWHPIQDEVKKIKRSPEGHRRRTWAYLWSAIRRVLSYDQEDRNDRAFTAGVPSNTSGFVAKDGDRGISRKELKQFNKWKEQQEKEKAAVGGIAAGQGDKAKGKGKDDGKANGKAKAEPKAKTKPKPAPKSKALTLTPEEVEVRKKICRKKHEDRTPAERKLLCCVHFAKGECQKGDSCEYSHRKKDVDDFLHRDKLRKEKEKAEAAAAQAGIDYHEEVVIQLHLLP